jgi:putative nucleotidyltransferase with HDIG domain
MGTFQAAAGIGGNFMLESRISQHVPGEEGQSVFSLQHRLEESLNDIACSIDDPIKMIASLIEIRDPYTAGHQKRVAYLGQEIAGKMGLPADKVELIKQAAFVHDIGKIYVPVEILNKAGKLTDVEYEHIKLHPQIGFTILNKGQYISGVDRIVLQHHERINGSGYPFGLAGEQIALEARILSVADVIDAMAVARPYRPALGVNTALSEIQNNCAALYDERVVEASLQFFGEKGFKPGQSPLFAG